MTFLAENLTKYYKKRANKLVFINGKSLNTLSLDIWAYLKFRNFDSSILSKTINSERLFNLVQLDGFCNVLQLSSQQRKELRISLTKDILNNSQLNYDEVLEKNSIDASNIDLSKLAKYIHELRTQGFPNLVIQLANIYHDFFTTQRNMFHKIYNLNLRNALINIKLELLRSYGEVYPSNQLKKLVSTEDSRILQLNEVHRNSNLFQKASMTLGGVYYVMNDWEKSVCILENAFYKNSNKSKIELIRTLILNYAYTCNFIKFKYILKFAIKELTHCSDQNNVASLLEAIARSYSIFGKTKLSRSILISAQNLNISPFYYSQIVRGIFFSFHKEKINKLRIDYDLLLNFAKQTNFNIIDRFKRHKSQIQYYLIKLNTMYGSN
ncbi:hypothetical protein HY214_02260 [Candidatus Roizmanbacteria bacterium]|nr:hypothetical protein [Candidatus Roizmanbacteria bacterium]